MAHSRLKKHLQNQAIKNIFLVTGGLLFLIVFLFVLGPKFLIGFSILAGKMNGENSSNTTVQQKTSYVEPPTLNTTYDATNSATTTITGLGLSKQRVRLYKNDQYVKETTVKDDNSFSFHDVTLSDGNNTFKTKARTSDNQESNYSNVIKILHSNKQPNVTISSPSDGQTLKKEQSPIKVTGTTDIGVKVTVNDFWAIVDATGTYSYTYTLHDGDNTLTVVATDQAGNTTTKMVKIRVE